MPRELFEDFLAETGADLARVLSHLPQHDADALMDELCAGVKEEAENLRSARVEERV